MRYPFGVWIARAALLVSVASACNALTGADSLVAEDSPTQNASADGGSSGTSGGTTPVTPKEDGGSVGHDATTPVIDSGPPPDPNTVALSSKFDTAAECTAWTATNGTKTYSTTLGRTAAGSCILCASEAGDASFERVGKAPIAGQLSVVAYARRQPGTTTPPGFNFTVVASVGTVGAGQPFSNEIWTQAGNSLKVGVQKDESITVRFTVRDALKGDCIVVDDVLAFVQ